MCFAPEHLAKGLHAFFLHEKAFTILLDYRLFFILFHKVDPCQVGRGLSAPDPLATGLSQQSRPVMLITTL